VRAADGGAVRGSDESRVVRLHLRGAADYGEPLCQGLSNATALEEWAAGELLSAVEPAAVAAVAGVEGQRAELTRQWRLKRERAAFDVDRACRQFQACEPDNRLVARELERRWEEALKAKRQLDDECERFTRSAPVALSDGAVSSIRALAADLPTVWSATTTTPADRRRSGSPVGDGVLPSLRCRVLNPVWTRATKYPPQKKLGHESGDSASFPPFVSSRESVVSPCRA